MFVQRFCGLRLLLWQRRAKLMAERRGFEPPDRVTAVNRLAICRIRPALPPLQISKALYFIICIKIINKIIAVNAFDALSFRGLWPVGYRPSSFPSKSEGYRSLTVVSTSSKIMSSISWYIRQPPYLIFTRRRENYLRDLNPLQSN